MLNFTISVWLPVSIGNLYSHDLDTQPLLIRTKDRLEEGDKIAAAIRSRGRLMGVIKLEIYPGTGTVSYSVQDCTQGNETVTELEDVLKESGKESKLIEIRKDAHQIGVKFEGVTLVTITFDSVVKSYPGLWRVG